MYLLHLCIYIEMKSVNCRFLPKTSYHSYNTNILKSSLQRSRVVGVRKHKIRFVCRMKIINNENINKFLFQTV